jgi:hypothetical protein
MTGFVGFGGALEDSEAMATTHRHPTFRREGLMVWERITR